MCRLIKFSQDEERCLKIASEVISEGGIVAYPTESYYALGVSAMNDAALARLFDLKKRPPDKALPLIVWSCQTLESLVKSIPDIAEELMNRYWPGPLTLIFDAVPDVSRILTGGTGRVAVRVPGKSIAYTLVSHLRIPLTATSANPSAMSPALDAKQVMEYFGKEIDLIIDGGVAPGGLPSTIVDVTARPPRVLRMGRIELTEQELVTGRYLKN
jgi:L-threonylcarbamoyladenylate synthase